MTSPINKHLHLDPRMESHLILSEQSPASMLCLSLYAGLKVVCLLTGASVTMIPSDYRKLGFMQEGKILDISVEQNRVSVTWYLNTPEKGIPPVETPVMSQKLMPKQAHIKDFLIAAVKQAFAIYQPKKIIFTNHALQKMKEHHLSERDVKHTVFSGKYVEGKHDMVSKQYNGYEIGVITRHEKATNTYIVLSAWKRNRR